MIDANSLKPGEPMMVGGYDWSWAFVVFADIADRPGYKISSLGHIWSSRGQGYRRGPFRKWFRMALCPNEWGYLHCGTRVDGKSKVTFAHRMVLENFIGPCPPDMEACHNNGNTFNNRIDNLRWGTRKDNAKDKMKHGTIARGSKIGHSSTTEDQVFHVCQLLSLGTFPWNVARQTGVALQVVHQIRSRLNWRYISDHFEFPILRERNKAQGTANYNAKLTEESVKELWELYRSGLTQGEIADYFGVTKPTISKVLLGRSWTHVRP